MKKLTRIIIAKDMEDLVDDGRAEFKHWGQKRFEMAYVGKMMYWLNSDSHYTYIGETKPWRNKK